MRMHLDKRGFVLSGAALLLVLPAMIIVASCFAIIEMGGETTALQATADKVFHAGKDIERVVENIWYRELLFDNGSNANAKFAELAENYRATTGLLVDITPTWMLWTHVLSTEENRYGGAEYSKIEKFAPDNWRYYFEDGTDNDFNEPILLVEKLAENLRITLVDYSGAWVSDIYYSDNKIWSNVTTGSPSIGNDTEVDGTVQLRVSIYVRDPKGAAQYSSTIDLS